VSGPPTGKGQWRYRDQSQQQPKRKDHQWIGLGHNLPNVPQQKVCATLRANGLYAEFGRQSAQELTDG
jgi:hypothetical protein